MIQVSLTPMPATAVLKNCRPIRNPAGKKEMHTKPRGQESTTPSSTGKRASAGSGHAKRRSSSWFSDEDTSAKHTSAIRSEKFLSARINELCAIAKSVPVQDGSKNIGRSLRRRAGSFRSYRLPLIIRARPSKKPKIALDFSCVKPACRAKRRFHRQLALRSCFSNSDDFEARKPVWLETHHWHCKRLHMSVRWGFVLADQRCDTGIRAAGRWARTASTLHDASYMSCLQLSGPEQQILEIMRLALGSTSDSSLPAFDAPTISGGREVEAVLYRPDSHPFGAVAPVRIMWRPKVLEASVAADSIRTIWLWTHPAAKDETLQMLSTLAKVDDPSKSARMAKNAVVISDLSNELLRFELRGPCSDSVLKAVFCPLDEEFSRKCNISALWGDSQPPSPAIKLLPGQSVMVRCHDPRLLFPLPQHRALASRSIGPETEPNAVVRDKPWLQPTQVPPGLASAPRWGASAAADGPLWDAAGRASFHGRKAESVAGVNARRSGGLLRPVRLPTAADRAEGDTLEALCVMLLRVEAAGGHCGLASSGWDVLLPRGWGATVFQQVRRRLA